MAPVVRGGGSGRAGRTPPPLPACGAAVVRVAAGGGTGGCPGRRRHSIAAAVNASIGRQRRGNRIAAPALSNRTRHAHTCSGCAPGDGTKGAQGGSVWRGGTLVSTCRTSDPYNFFDFFIFGILFIFYAKVRVMCRSAELPPPPHRLRTSGLVHGIHCPLGSHPLDRVSFPYSKLLHSLLLPSYLHTYR